jgi:hypothetical protein
MTEVSYVPGSWTAVAFRRCWLLIDSPPDSAAIREIWQQGERQTEQEPGIWPIIASLLRPGLGQLPDFVLLTVEGDDRHLICRGRGRATLAGVGAPEQVAGTGLRTWREVAVGPDVEQVVLGLQPAEAGHQLPASAGVFLADCVTVALSAEPGVREPSAPASGVPALSVPALDAAVSGALPPSVHKSRAVDPAGLELSVSDASTAGPAGTVPAPDESPGYDDFLFGATRARTVEDAAMRSAPAAPTLSSDVPPATIPVNSAPAANFPPPGSASPDKSFAAPSNQPPTDLPTRQAGFPSATSYPLPSGLIDGVPWASRQPAPSQAGPRPSSPPRPVGPTEEEAGTVTTVRRADVVSKAGRMAVPHDKIGPSVSAQLCPNAHPNPPSSTTCRICGANVAKQDSVIVPRPVLGVLRFSTGDVISLDRGVVMGRNPSTEYEGDERPHVVKLPSGDGEVSRTHLMVTIDGWHVLVTDLKSTNGTLVELPGQPPERLRAGEALPIQPGTRVTLADGIDFRFEVA